MRLKNLMVAAVAVSMTASPVLAANPAASLSVAPASARASAEEGDSDLAGGGFLVAIIAAAAIIAGIIIIADNDDSPSSR